MVTLRPPARVKVIHQPRSQPRRVFAESSTQSIKLFVLHKSSVACDTAKLYRGSPRKPPTETEAGINCLQKPIGNATKGVVISWVIGLTNSVDVELVDLRHR